MDICKSISKLLKWLENQISFTNFLSTIGVVVIIFQLHNSNMYKQYDNFLYFNKIYDEWYDEMPQEISRKEQTSFSNLDGSGKAWVRRYFNLYAEEYYFYQKGMIPKEMWHGLIHGCKDGKIRAAFRNLKKYPALLEGYNCWKKEEVFGFPEEFEKMLDSELKACNIDIQDVKNCS